MKDVGKLAVSKIGYSIRIVSTQKVVNFTSCWQRVHMNSRIMQDWRDNTQGIYKFQDYARLNGMIVLYVFVLETVQQHIPYYER